MKPLGAFLLTAVLALPAVRVFAAEAAAAPKAAEAKPKKKAAKGKRKPAAESKYKSRALTESSDFHYRFDASGNPVGGAPKKKPAKAKKKSSEDAEEKPACSEDEPCSEKKSSDADAL